MTTTTVAVVEGDSVVMSMVRASAALAEAKTIQQTKKVLDVAAAAEIYARRQKLGEDIADQAAAIKVEALRKLGQMLKVTPKASGQLVAGKDRFGGTRQGPPKNDVPTLADLGISKNQSAIAQKLAELPEEQFAQVREGHVSVAKAIAAVEATKPKKMPTHVQPRKREPEAVEPDPDLSTDPAELLEEFRAAAEKAEKRVAELEALLNADDQRKKLLEMQLTVNVANRRRDDAMAHAAALQQRVQRYERTLARIGRAVGERDLDMIAPTVEATARRFNALANSRATTR
jgi:hypothetical protein